MRPSDKKYSSGVSVIVCCYNSAPRLPETLRYLAAQKVVQTLDCEIIVVDNSSTDNTAEVSLNEWSKYNSKIKLRVVRELKKGLRFAKQRGVSEALYDTIIFCDDDNWLCDQYVQLTFDILSTKPTVGAVGGHGQVISDTLIPDWFEEYSGYYACYKQGIQSGFLDKPQAFLYGAGMGLRHDLADFLLLNYPYLILTGRLGENLSSGEDNEFCYIIRLLGFNLWYSDQLQFFHFMPSQRLQKKYLLSLVRSIAYSSMRLIVYHYVLNGKKVRSYTWLMDFSYRIAELLFTIPKSVFIPDRYKRKIALAKCWNSLLAISDQFGIYKKTYRSILILRDNSN